MKNSRPDTSSCAHCGLPVRTREGVVAARVYCCVGCRLAAAITTTNGGAVGFLDARLCLSAFLAMGVMTFSTVLYGEAIYDVEMTDAGARLVRGFGRGALIAFSFPVLILLGFPLLRGAWLDLRRGLLRMDGLITIATLAAFGLSTYNTLRGEGEVYFETATMVLVLVTFGRRLEVRARLEGRDAATALNELLPAAAHRTSATGGETEDVAPADLQAGDRVRVLPGESVPADVTVIEGSSELSAAHLNGESTARPVEVGDGIPAGAINGTGALLATVTRTAAEGSLGRLRELLETPLDDTSRLRLTDRLAARLAAATMVVAALGFVRSTALHGVGAGIQTTLAVLLVACPCALGLATPLAYRALRVALARRGVLVHDAAAMEIGARVNTVVLDKTGTLTAPGPRLRVVDGSRVGTHDAMAALIATSGHALARALPARAATAESVRIVPGSGVIGRYGDADLVAGSPRWMDERGHTWTDDLAARRTTSEAGGGTLVALAEDERVTGLAVVEHDLHPTAAAAVAALQRLELDCEIASGDGEGAVERIASALEIPAGHGLGPEDKLARIAHLRATGRTVALVGDGVNDAPAMRAADLGIAVGTAMQTTRAAAAVEILSDDLRAIALVISGCRRLRRVVTGNLAWAVAYNVVALAAAAFGLLHPLVAVVSMTVSSLAIASRSARLLDFGEEAP